MKRHEYGRVAGGARRFTVALALVATQACRERETHELPANAPFVALERDFQHFESWEEIDLSRRPPEAQTHLAGKAREFINQRPEPGSRDFPVGTILVKSMAKDDGKHDIFAMVKRGAGYNPAGAKNWEWFELTRRADATFAIVWRGINAPSGEGYGGTPAGGCNACHAVATSNDFVQAESLSLKLVHN